MTKVTNAKEALEKLNESNEEETVSHNTRNLQFDGIDEYKNAIAQLKEKIVELVKEGSMSEATAAKLIADSEYSFFQQITQISYK